jgi:hypothetical protein
MSRPVIALAAFSLAIAFRSDCEDNQHGSQVGHTHDRQRRCARAIAWLQTSTATPIPM